MIRHLLKLVWNRKRTNLLIVAEILCSFVVVFAVVTTGIYLLQRYTQPLGFDYKDLWRIDIDFNSETGWGDWSDEEAETFARLMRELESMDAVVAVAGANTAPYGHSVHITGWQYENRDVGTELGLVTPEFLEVVGLELVSGRWFTPEDRHLEWTPLVVNPELARELTGDEDPLGRRVSDEDEEQDLRVIGVIQAFRRGGELSGSNPTEDGHGSDNYAFRLAKLGSGGTHALRNVLVKVAPGTTAAFEEPMVERLQQIAREWSFDVAQLETARADYLRLTLTPLAALGLIAGFLLIMVVLGLTGVMWQNVTRRTREIGLRRATGARRASIHRQIVGEVMITAGLGLFIGILLVIQVPLIGPFTYVPYAVVLPAMIVAGVLILLLAGLCGLYPGWSATRIHPAEALHYE